MSRRHLVIVLIVLAALAYGLVYSLARVEVSVWPQLEQAIEEHDRSPSRLATRQAIALATRTVVVATQEAEETLTRR
jgi:hypothetical protein